MTSKQSPKPDSNALILAQHPDFMKGWNDGRSGQERAPVSASPEYKAGFRQGVIALEQYENGDHSW